MSKQSITEESGVHKQWYEDAKNQTVETLPEFIRHLTQDYEHDYGTICHAMSAAACASCWAINGTDQGGITGFQAGAVMWGFISHWMSKEGKPLRLIDYSDMLYPQYEERFKTISKDTLEYLQKEASTILAEKDTMNANVRRHMEFISGGGVPFGFSVGN
jgi:hypothetical protein